MGFLSILVWPFESNFQISSSKVGDKNQGVWNGIIKQFNKVVKQETSPKRHFILAAQYSSFQKPSYTYLSSEEQ